MIEPYYKQDGITIYNADCRDVLPQLESVDLLLTDPPFGLGNFVQVTGNVRGEKVTWNESPPDAALFEIMHAKSKHRIIWGANYFNCFEPDGGAIVWVKNQPMPDFSKADIASCSFHKRVEIYTQTWTNFVNTKETNHPCERPVSLYAWCLKKYASAGNLILDPFMGSGSVLRAAKNCNLNAIGIEVNERYAEIAAKRMAQSAFNFEEVA
jgi:DNA modification methylase